MGVLRTFRLIPRNSRRGGIVVIIFSVIRALFDLIGLAVMVPVLILVMSPKGIAGNKWLFEIYNNFGFTSESVFTWVICGIVIFVILLKGAANLVITRFQNKYMMSLYRYYAREMLDSYYRQGLLFIKNRNSAKLTHEVNYMTIAYVQDVPMNMAIITSDFLLIAMMFVGIMLYNPVAALMVFAILIPMMFIYIALLRNKLLSYGKLENEERRKQARIVQETFHGYSEIEINGAFPAMEAQFDEGLKKISWYRKTILTVSQTPGVIIEIGIAITLVALVLIRVDAILLGVFGVVAMRMLPAVKNIVNRWILIRNANFAEDIIEEGISTRTEATVKTTERIAFREGIRVDNLSFGFSTEGSPVIDNFSMEIHKGERIGIKGVSGGGKTTLFNLLLGLYPPSSGEILIDGAPLTSSNRRQWQNIIGYVPQEVFIMDSSIAENIALGGEIDRDRIVASLEAARLGDFLLDLPEGIDTQIGEGGSRLSGGQKQRVGIARALYKNAEILFFDEATSSLDSQTESEINEAIKELSKMHSEVTIVIIAHRENSLAFCDRIIEIG